MGDIKRALAELPDRSSRQAYLNHLLRQWQLNPEMAILAEDIPPHVAEKIQHVIKAWETFLSALANNQGLENARKSFRALP